MEIFLHREVGPLACNCYIAGDPVSKEAIVIDPGGDAEDLLAAIEEDGLTITAIVATHAHFDHVLAAEQLRAATGAPFYLHDSDKPVLQWLQESGRMFLGVELPPPPEIDSVVDEGDELVAGAVRLTVIHTPGHSPGSIALAGDDALFAGDTLFAGGIGRSDLPGGDPDALIASIKSKLLSLEEDLPVYPGHGLPTTIAREKIDNPFVGTRSRLWLPGS